MALKADLMAAGMPWQAANKLGLDTLTVFAAAGTTQATATTLTANCANITSGTGGVIIGLPNEAQMIANNSGLTITVYPVVGGAINGGATNAGISLPNGKSLFGMGAGLNFLAVVSA